jgi:tetratricopeptide (TPR) repeat protein
MFFVSALTAAAVTAAVLAQDPRPATRPPAEHQDHRTHEHTGTDPAGAMPLLKGLGTWHHRISTTSPEAQRYFDQGLRLTYGFNHDEAVRSFERATQLDPDCAMCHWGIAYALGPNINLPMEGKTEPRALAAIRRAADLKTRTTAGERALIEAMALRYGEPAGAARAERDAAYADAMRNVAARFPADIDAQTLFADAMLNLRPWNQWTRDGKPQPGTLELVGVLERALARQPAHAGACHFYIHAIEASETPERALPCAERLPVLMPGAGHVVHMPAHVFLRVGRYEAAARANIAAVEADQRYFAAHAAKPGVYPMFYAPHNLHFLWSAYLLSGQREKALTAARTLAERVKLEEARTTASLEVFLPPAILTLARFGEWDAVIAEAAPPVELRYATGLWHYARGLAFAAKKDSLSAEGELTRVRALSTELKDDMIIVLNPAPALLKLAAEVLAGRIAAAERRFDPAVAHFRAAAVMEDALTFDEPPPWYHSARNLLGETLLEAGRPAEAAAAFRDDLRYLPETGWSLSGLERALRAQGKRQEADDAARRFKAAWKHADHPLPGSDQYGMNRPSGTR